MYVLPHVKLKNKIEPITGLAGTWETQGLRETMTLLCGLLGSSVSVRPIPCPVWRARPAGVPDGPVPVSAHAPE